MAYKSAFDIESTPDELTVKTIEPSSVFSFLLNCVIGIFFLCILLFLISGLNDGTPSLPSHHSENRWIVIRGLFLVAAFLWFLANFLFQVIRSFFPSGESLHCDRENLVIGKIPTINFRGKWTYTTFPVTAVKQMRWGIIKFRRYGGGAGLVFAADDKTYKLFLGLPAPEASTILDALQQLHVDIIRDPAMPMSVEMVESSRKSWFRFFTG